MFAVTHELLERERLNDPIRVAVIGAGWFGSGLIRELIRWPGMKPSLIVTRTPRRAEQALKEAGFSGNGIVITDSLDKVRSLRDIDLVYEATGEILAGARAALRAIEEGKHFVTVNAEMDATVGCILAERAKKAGVVYSNSDGDQPGVIARMLAEIRLMGFSITVAGNCKGFLDRYQTPEGVMPWVRAGHNPRKVCAFADGSKQSLECAVLSNATGLIPDRRGMHGIRTTKQTLLEDFLGVIEHEGVVDFALGMEERDQGAGVFVIGKRSDAATCADMAYLKKGPGPYYLFFRDYHLCYFEAPKTIAEAAILTKPTLAPLKHTADVLTVAKKDLAAGTSLDGIGGSTVYGLLDTSQNVRRDDLLPLGISGSAVLMRPVEKDTPITRDMVEFPEQPLLLSLREEQERTLWTR